MVIPQKKPGQNSIALSTSISGLLAFLVSPKVQSIQSGVQAPRFRPYGFRKFAQGSVFRFGYTEHLQPGDVFLDEVADQVRFFDFTMPLMALGEVDQARAFGAHDV